MASRTSNKGLWQFGDNAPNWHHYFNHNVDTLNASVFRLIFLNDVILEALQDKSILKWDSQRLKWIVVFNRGN